MVPVSTCNEMAELYTTAMHRQWSSNQLHGLDPFEMSLIKSYLPDCSGAIANVGCGGGRETVAMYSMGYKQVTGVDLTPAMLDMARQYAKQHGMPVEFHQGSAGNLPFDDHSLDAVTMFGNIYGHITPRQERLSSLREIRRVLKPGGLLLFNASSRNEAWKPRAYFAFQDLLHVLYNPCRFDSGDKRFKEDRSPATPNTPRHHFFRPREIDIDAQECGFTVQLRSTAEAVVTSPRTNATSVRRGGRLVYVLAAN